MALAHLLALLLTAHSLKVQAPTAALVQPAVLALAWDPAVGYLSGVWQQVFWEQQAGASLRLWLEAP